MVIPYFPLTSCRTRLGDWEKAGDDPGPLERGDDLLRWPLRFHEQRCPCPTPCSWRPCCWRLAQQQGGPPAPTRGLGFKFQWTPAAYLQTRWFDLLSSSVDEDQEFWAMHCLALPSYKWCQGRFQPKMQEVPLDQRRIYIHTKTVMVDDVWATIGSANMNVRSYTSDTEINAAFIDGQLDDRGLHVSARDYRATLWGALRRRPREVPGPARQRPRDH